MTSPRMPVARSRPMHPRAAGCAAAAVVLIVSSASNAQQASSSRIDDLVRQAARAFAESTQAPVPQQPATSAPPASAPVTTLTLDAAVRQGLEHNLDIAVQRANPDIAALSVAASKAVYLPVFSSTIGEERQFAPPITILTGGERVETTTTVFNATATENVPVGGGALSVAWANTRVFSNSVFYNFNPAYNATLTFQFTQPLVRGARTDAAREQIVVSKVSRDLSDLQLQATIANILSNVRNAYWDLVFAVQSVDVARQSVDLAHRLVEDNQAQVKYGTMTRLDLTTALSQAASSEAALVQAEGNRRLAELALKRLIVSGPHDPLWQAQIDAVDRPEVTEQPIDIEAAVRRALDERSDLQQARRQVVANQAAAGLLSDQTRVQADLVASYGLAGIGGTQLIRGGNIFGGPVVAVIPGTYGDALTSLGGRDFPTWNVAVNLSYPFGLSQARAAAARAQIQVRQVDTEIRQLEVQVTSEVTSAAIQVRNDFDLVRAARIARQVAADRLDAEQKKFAAGMSTNYVVVQAQRDLADAAHAQLQAEVNYRKALVEFDRARQTTLQAAGVTVVTAGGLQPAAVGSARGAGSQ